MNGAFTWKPSVNEVSATLPRVSITPVLPAGTIVNELAARPMAAKATTAIFTPLKLF